MKRNLLKCFIVICLIFVSNSTTCDENKYAIFMDAGSSGTRLIVVKYIENQLLHERVPDYTEIYTNKITPGISSFAEHPERASTSLKPLLDAAEKTLADQSVNLKNVDLYIFATAGMRLLETKTQEQIYQNIEKFISEKYSFNIRDIRTIPGEQEALYAWLEVNYLKSHFDSTTSVTNGILDMGGASTQIAFDMSEGSEILNKQPNIINININHKNYSVYVKSFLGLGMNAAFDRMREHRKGNTCFPHKYSDEKNTDIKMFDFSSCKEIYKSILSPYEISSLNLPLQKTEFIGISGLYDSFKFFQSTQNLHSDKFTANIERLCNVTWDLMHSLFPSENGLHRYCANGTYFNTLFFDTYRIPSKNLTVIEEIDGKSVGWMRGAVLYHLFSSTQNSL